MKIGGFQKVSFIEYPGKISAVIFTQGCNFRCPYCHNPELVYEDLFTETIFQEEVLSFLNTRKQKLEGVVVTGGEPTMQDDLPRYLSLIRDMGYTVKLNTNGSRPDVLEALISGGLVDYIAMDIKAPFCKYKFFTRSLLDVARIAESISLIKDSGLEHEFRTTFDQSILNHSDIEQIRLLAGYSSLTVQKCNLFEKVYVAIRS